MIIGDPAQFALESGITRAFVRPYFNGLGFFRIHVGGMAYGVKEPDATMLGCSFGEVEERLARRGTHTAPFAAAGRADEIADAFFIAVYDPEYEDTPLLSLSGDDFKSLFSSNQLQWAPDGDEAFDDSSRVLHFDVGDRVRLIAYRPTDDGTTCRHDPATLRDQWIESEQFYEVLSQWRNAVYAEWAAMPKSPDDWWKSLGPANLS